MTQGTPLKTNEPGNTGNPGNTAQNTATMEPVDSEEVESAGFVVSAEVESDDYSSTSPDQPKRWSGQVEG